MKRLIVAAILFVVVIATYLTSLFYITDSCETAKGMVENSITAYTKNQTAKKLGIPILSEQEFLEKFNLI